MSVALDVRDSQRGHNGEILEQWVSHWGPIERQVMSFDDDGRRADTEPREAASTILA